MVMGYNFWSKSSSKEKEAKSTSFGRKGEKALFGGDDNFAREIQSKIGSLSEQTNKLARDIQTNKGPRKSEKKRVTFSPDLD